ncbi:HlyD family efflux transporter periplasmic adaptor subunit [Aetokthonos hydrillicola Thurmond2011]|jgi:HlyD family secretion protein|uniref:HlyD family efflux transporter periplasmic adaptor subunit n=1 Tax=Aetokthonos hydrillicola Thurmond2011 TaxID=2712845 RepID=A0AAP5IEQ8_9CYAN|nr:HlyD family efflux transporter periplasmic adaptor subunit [Aetokthonos hydrillicola]MBO3462814.1 HlyD family efflux transporter periplasmic adaptor subunit [Aetokthonos hydrillicola CCALA 1050]MBW4591012.1 HlyD family efflux transporter periplasmic adaptor subunit [Aetokthonos hydrillicola CCALA 1050]MDR9900326.1 HlyD family efflux transporter periplasmic adaptor subunit [Aetokthonos hydrillicola Thurmond2011]
MSRVSEKPRLTEQPVEKPKVWWVLIMLPVVIAAGVLAKVKLEQITKVNEPVASTPAVTSINALGRLQPRGEVIKLSAPTGLQGTSRVEQIFVREGEQVKKSQLIAILDSFSTNQAAVEQAKAKLQETRGNLTNVKLGGPRDIQAQRAVIDRLEAQLQGERNSQQATIARLQAQLRGEATATVATVHRLQAQLEGQRDILRATLQRTRAQADNAVVDAGRYESLYQQGAISKQVLDTKRLSAEINTQQVTETQANLSQSIATLQQQVTEARANQLKAVQTLQQQLVEAKETRNKTIATLQKQIDEEKAKYNRLLDVRPTDVEIAQSQVTNAIAQLRKAEADLALSYVKAPISGEILKIHTKAGESLKPDGIAEIGQTNQMIVVAEVPEDSIGKVRLGQQATISSDYGAFNGQLQGTIFQIGRTIGKKDVLNTDPAANIDARVVEVKIAVSQKDSERVSGLTNAQVVIDISI